MKKMIVILLTLTILLMSSVGCATAGSSNAENTSITQSAAADSNSEKTSAVSNTSSNTTAETDSMTDYSGAVAIILGSTSTATGKGVSINGNTVTISAGGSYTVKGTLTNGQLKVDTTDKVHIELNGVSVTNSSGPALFILNAKKATITLKAGTVNTLTDGGSDIENDAALFSNDTLVIEGSGALNVTGSNLEGISSDDDIIINGGTIRVKAPDDGINAHDDITINGGYVYVASMGDGIDSNGTMNITGGTVISQSGLTDANGGLDADGEITVTGGTIISTGSRISSPGTNSTQKSLLVSFGSTQKAGQLVCIQQNGKDIVTFEPSQDYQQLFYSSGTVAEGVSYNVYSGGSTTGSKLDGVYSGGSYTAGTSVSTVTTDSAASSGNGFGKGGGGGGRGGQQPPKNNGT